MRHTDFARAAKRRRQGVDTLTTHLQSTPHLPAILPRMRHPLLAACLMLTPIAAQTATPAKADVPWLAFARSTFA